MESLFFFSKSFWIFLFQGLISFFNPDALNEDAKIKLFESGIDSGVIYLRSLGFNATYDDFYADIDEDTILITNLSLKREFEPGYDSFCNIENLEPRSIWHPKLCEFILTIDEISIKGIELGYKSDDPVSIEYLIISIWFLFFEPNNPRSIIPAQINNIEIRVGILNTTPRNIMEINVANKGPNPLNIG